MSATARPMTWTKTKTTKKPLRDERSAGPAVARLASLRYWVPPTAHPARWPRDVVGAASAATNEAAKPPQPDRIGTEAPPTVHLAHLPRAPCGSDFSRDELSHGFSSFGCCRD